MNTIDRDTSAFPPLDLAQRAVEIASDKLAANIVLLDIRSLTAFADYFVLCSADSVRQINALVEDISVGVKSRGGPIGRREGAADSGWALLDYGDVLVHIFSQEMREYYALEELWRGAVPLVRVQ